MPFACSVTKAETAGESMVGKFTFFVSVSILFIPRTGYGITVTVIFKRVFESAF